MPDRASDVTRIVTGGRARGLTDDQIRALVARYDERTRTPPPAAATRGMLAPSTMAGDPRVDPASTGVLPAQDLDLSRGILAGAASTVFHGGDVIRRMVGADRIIDQPDVQATITPPETPRGQLGFRGEQIAEYALPARRVYGMTKALPWFRRTMAQAGTAAGVTGAQTGGDPSAMITAAGLGAMGDTAFRAGGAVGRAAQRAAAGAREGGVGGAVAAAVRTVAPGQPRTLMIQALKPTSTKVRFPFSLDRAMPEINEVIQSTGTPINGIDDLVVAVSVAKKRVYQQLGQVRGTAQGFEVDLSPVANAMERSIPKKLRLERPAVAQQLQDAAGVYRRPFSLDDAEQLLKETNAELEGLYAKYPGSMRKAIASDPEWARLDAQGKALRTSIDATLDRAAAGGGDAAKELRRRYGALLDVESEAFRRVNVAQRQQPESLSEQLSAARAAMEIARGAWRLVRGDPTGAADIAGGVAMRDTAKYLKDQQTTDALIRRAFAGYTGRSTPVAMPSRRPVAGLLPAGARPMPAAPDPSFVRGVPAVPAQSVRRALPPPGARPMPAHEVSGGAGVRARSIVVRDPRTGRMRRIYVSEGVE